MYHIIYIYYMHYIIYIYVIWDLHPGWDGICSKPDLSTCSQPYISHILSMSSKLRMPRDRGGHSPSPKPWMLHDLLEAPHSVWE